MSQIRLSVLRIQHKLVFRQQHGGRNSDYKTISKPAGQSKQDNCVVVFVMVYKTPIVNGKNAAVLLHN